LNKKSALVLLLMCCLAAGAIVNAQVSVSPKPAPEPEPSEYLQRNLKTAHSLINVGNYDRALDLLNALETTYGRLPEIAAELKNVYYLKKDYATLKAMIVQAMQIRPDDFDLTCQLGEIFFLTDSLDQALAVWRKASELAGVSQKNYLMLAGYYERYGFFDEAIGTFISARRILGNPLLFQDELTDIYISQRDYAAAAAEYLRGLENNAPENRQVSRRLISIMTDSDHPDQVEQVVKQALSENPDNAQLHSIMGDINVIKDSLGAAFENYKKADSLSDSKGGYLADFISVCLNAGQYEMAIKAADYYLRGHGFEPRVALLKAASLAELGAYQPALELLASLENSARDLNMKFEAVYSAGELYAFKLGDYQTAASTFTRIADFRLYANYSYRAKMRLAEVNVILGQYSQARPIIEEIIKGKAGDDLIERAFFLEAEIDFFTHDFEMAKKSFTALAMRFPLGFYVNDCLDRQALLSDAEGDTAAYLMADADRYFYSGKTDSAIIKMEQARKLKTARSAEHILFLLANYYGAGGRWDQAADAYEQYNSEFSDGLYIDRSIFNLAEIYYEKADRPEEADLLFQKLVSDFPASPLLEKARSYLNRLKSS